MKSTRRDALRALLVTAGVATVGSFASFVSLPSTASTPSTPSGGSGDAHGYLEGVEGSSFAGCTVTEIGEIEHGTIPLTFVDAAGETFMVDLLRRDDAVPGVANAGSVALYMRIGPDPQDTTEAHGLAVMALARRLGEREAAGLAVPSLLTLRERATVREQWFREAAARTA